MPDSACWHCTSTAPAIIELAWQYNLPGRPASVATTTPRWRRRRSSTARSATRAPAGPRWATDELGVGVRGVGGRRSAGRALRPRQRWPARGASATQRRDPGNGRVVPKGGHAAREARQAQGGSHVVPTGAQHRWPTCLIETARSSMERARLVVGCASTLIRQQRYRKCAQWCRRRCPTPWRRATEPPRRTPTTCSTGH